MIKYADNHYLTTNRRALLNELTQRLKAAGVFTKNPTFYLRKLSFYAAIHFATLYLIAHSTHWLWTILWITLDGLYILRIGFVAHDLAHGIVSTKKRYRLYLAELVWCFFLGVSREFWDNKHTLHHRFTNISAQDNGDPDIQTPPFILAEQQGQAVANKPLNRWIARYQHILYWPTLSLLVFSLTQSQIKFLFLRKYKQYRLTVNSNKWLVTGLILLGYGVNNIPIFLAHGAPVAVALLLYKYLLVGFIIGFAFAMNHVGLPTLSGDLKVDHLTLQTYTTRNLSGPFGRWFWGVLAYQTEHHLWPSVAWDQLPTTSAITKAFCTEHGIIHNEVRPWAAWRDSCQRLRQLGREAVLVR